MLQITCLRRRLNLTQARFAALALMHASDISKIEAGRLRPYPGQLRRLARVLGARPEELLVEVPGEEAETRAKDESLGR
ncbi:MAG: helix-turn-helix transcriptional regulator [Bacillota bacterium]